MMKALLKALWWLREGCLQEDDRTAIPALISAVDTLAAGAMLPGLREFALNRLELKYVEEVGARKAVLDYVEYNYELRSRILHGNGKFEEITRDFQRDWTPTRKELENFVTNYMLISIEYMIEHPDCNDVRQLRLDAKPRHAVVKNIFL